MEFESAFDKVLKEFFVHLKSTNDEFRKKLKESDTSFKNGYNTNSEAFQARFEGKGNAFLEKNGPIHSTKVQSIEILDGFTIGDMYKNYEGMNDMSYANYLMRLMYALVHASDNEWELVKQIAAKQKGQQNIDGRATMLNEIMRLLASSSHSFVIEEETKTQALDMNTVLDRLPQSNEKPQSLSEAKQKVLQSLEGTSLKQPFEKIMNELSEEELNTLASSNTDNDANTIINNIMQSNILSKLMQKIPEMLSNGEIPLQDMMNDVQNKLGIPMEQIMNMSKSFMQ